jgi:diaminopimelate decarboxylase
MNYKKNGLYIENISIQRIAKKFGTPSYCYSLNKLKLNIRNFKKYFRSINPLLCFSVKSNSNLQILKEINKMGMGADVVSKGELIMALKSGISPKKIVFSGVGKTFDELKFAINKNILLINSESESEINQIEKISKIKRKKIDIGVRLNPNIDSKTLKKISTGKKEDKFGLTEINFLKAINKFKNSKYLNIRCLSVHIGSQITDHKPYAKMLKVIGSVIKKSNHNFDFVDLGGGMGIKYNKETKKLDYKKYNSIIKNFLNKYRTKIIFEPGRSIIGDTALLLTRVLYIKKTRKINFVILDAAMNDLMRPALYGSRHEIMASIKSKKMIIKKHEFVGPICEATDKFLSVPKFQTLREKDILAICDVGAYGMVLSSNYNLRAKPSEILINQSSSKIITKRQKLNNII